MTSTSESDQLEAFLGRVWGNGGRVYLAVKASETSFKETRALSWPTDKDQIVNFIMTNSKLGKDVYFPPAIYKDDATSRRKENVKESNVVWVDIDGGADAALTKWRGAELPEPTYRVQSSVEGKEHWYWVLPEAMPVSEYEPINQRIAKFLNADDCWDAGRLLRPPFTNNYKNRNDPKAVDIIDKVPGKHPLSEFSSLPGVRTAITREISDLNNIPPVENVLAKYTWDSVHLDVFRNPPQEGQGARYKALMKLAHFGAEQAMTDEEIYAIINDVDLRVKKFVGRNDRERRLAETIAKARQAHPFVNAPTVQDSKEESQTEFTANELLAADFPVDWLVEDFMTKGSINILAAPSGLGKSRAMMQLMGTFAEGSRFLKWNITRQVKTLYLSLEMGGPTLKHFLTQLSDSKPFEKEVSDNMIFVPVGTAMNFATEGYGYFKYVIEKHKPEVIIIDSLGTLTTGALDETTAKSINNGLKRIIAEFGITFILIHHSRKKQGMDKSDPDLDSVYGSQYVVTESELVMSLHKDDSGHVYFSLIKTRMIPYQDEPLELEHEQGFKFLVKDRSENDSSGDESFGSGLFEP